MAVRPRADDGGQVERSAGWLIAAGLACDRRRKAALDSRLGSKRTAVLLGTELASRERPLPGAWPLSMQLQFEGAANGDAYPQPPN